MRPDDMIAKAIKSAAEAKVARAAKVKVTTLPAQYMGTDSEGKGWVMLPGADGPTPVRRMAVEAKAGDTVAVTVGYGRAVVDSNISNPSAGVAGVTTVRRTAQQAQSTATEAAKDAQAAIGYATSARAAANDARSQADVAAAEAQAATGYAQSALSGAQTAQDAASQATADAATASEMAAQATQSAATANAAAADAQAQASTAATAARDALVQLAEVEDVMGTVEWIAEHGTYEPTQDAAVDDSKVYYERTGSGTQADPYVYHAVAEPTEAGLSGYYELHVDQAVSQYVSTHLALTDAGLYVLADANGYKLLLANTGMSVVDPQGHVMVTYGESITASPDRPFSIGNEDAYVLFTPETAMAPAKVVIGGNVELGNSQRLSDLLNAISYDMTWAKADGTYTFTGYAFKGGIDVSALYDPEFFTWLLRNESGETPLGTGRTCTVAQSLAGYHGTVVGGLEDEITRYLADEGGDRLACEDGRFVADMKWRV